jgi:hypothetical protein
MSNLPWVVKKVKLHHWIKPKQEYPDWMSIFAIFGFRKPAMFGRDKPEALFSRTNEVKRKPDNCILQESHLGPVEISLLVYQQHRCQKMFNKISSQDIFLTSSRKFFVILCTEMAIQFACRFKIWLRLKIHPKMAVWERPICLSFWDSKCIFEIKLSCAEIDAGIVPKWFYVISHFSHRFRRDNIATHQEKSRKWRFNNNRSVKVINNAIINACNSLYISTITSCKMKHVCTIWYNIAFVNSERWLAESRVDITQCQHRKFSGACKHRTFSYPSGFWHCYIITKI